MTRLPLIIQEMSNNYECITPLKNTQRSKLLVQILHESRAKNEANYYMNLKPKPRA
jgi:hypothetical protein